MFWSSVAGKMHTPRTPPSSTRCAPPSSIHLDLLGFLKSFTSYFGIQVSLGRNYLFVPTDLDLCPCRALMVVMILVRFVVMMIIWRLGLPDRRGHGRVESKSHNWVSTFYHFFVFLRLHQCECTNPVLCELEPIKIIRNLALRENGRKIATWNKYITISGTIFNIITVIIKITMAIATTRRLRSFPSGISAICRCLVSDLRLWPLTELGQV